MLSKYHMVYGAHGWGSDTNLHPNSNNLGESSLKAGGNCGLVLPTTLRFLHFLLQFLPLNADFELSINITHPKSYVKVL